MHILLIICIFLLQKSNSLANDRDFNWNNHIEYDNTIKVWNVENGKIEIDIKTNSKVNSFAVLQNGDLVSSSDKSIIIWV